MPHLETTVTWFLRYWYAFCMIVVLRPNSQANPFFCFVFVFCGTYHSFSRHNERQQRNGMLTKHDTTMRTNYCTELTTCGQDVMGAFPTGDGRYTTGEYAEAFLSSLIEDFFPRKQAQMKALTAA